MNVQLLLVAKSPEPGRAKTRLCPPCTPVQAAAIAAAALADTVDVLARSTAVRRTIVLDGRYPVPAGWESLPQRGDGLGQRLADAYQRTALPGTGTVLVGMDTPQLTPELVDGLAAGLDQSDAVLGPAYDGGWWGLGLRDPRHAAVLRDVPMSTQDTGQYTLEALLGRGLSVVLAPPLVDVDTAASAQVVAAACPGGRFAAAVNAHLLVPAR